MLEDQFVSESTSIPSIIFSAATMAESTFAFNVAYTVPVNGEGMTPTLTYGEFWKGLRRGGRNPHDFADYVASTEVHADQTATEFKRSLTLADGAVHSTRGTVLHQDVRIAEGLHVRTNASLSLHWRFPPWVAGRRNF